MGTPVYIYKLVRKLFGINIYIYFYHSSSASCTWKLNRPSKPALKIDLLRKS